MKQIRNKTGRPIPVPLEGGRTLHLGPRQTGQVSTQATERPSFQRLVERGEIEVVGDGETGKGGRGPRVLHEATQGLRQSKSTIPSGNRSGGE